MCILFYKVNSLVLIWVNVDTRGPKNAPKSLKIAMGPHLSNVLSCLNINISTSVQKCFFLSCRKVISEASCKLITTYKLVFVFKTFLQQADQDWQFLWICLQYHGNYFTTTTVKTMRKWWYFCSIIYAKLRSIVHCVSV